MIKINFKLRGMNIFYKKFIHSITLSPLTVQLYLITILPAEWRCKHWMYSTWRILRNCISRTCIQSPSWPDKSAYFRSVCPGIYWATLDQETYFGKNMSGLKIWQYLACRGPQYLDYMGLWPAIVLFNGTLTAISGLYGTLLAVYVFNIGFVIYFHCIIIIIHKCKI